jgi:hypothetical protein
VANPYRDAPLPRHRPLFGLMTEEWLAYRRMRALALRGKEQSSQLMARLNKMKSDTERDVDKLNRIARGELAPPWWHAAFMFGTAAVQLLLQFALK